VKTRIAGFDWGTTSATQNIFKLFKGDPTKDVEAEAEAERLGTELIWGKRK
jgi:hypothetical protein